jgi:hypothetical protein
MIKIFLLLIGLICADVFDGYTLYTAEPNYTTYLIDNDLNIVNEWYADCQPASMAYLQPDSTLIYPCKQDELMIEGTAAAGGRIIHYDWDGTILWDWECDEDWGSFQLHHDIEPTPNGTILVIAKEDINGFMPDTILEIHPDGMHGAYLVWMWRVADHMSANLYNPYTFYSEADYNQLDWNHFNAISLNQYGEILLSSRNWGEIYIIDWGGSSDILYRWGNPQNYGVDEEQILFAQHGVNQIPIGYPGEGNIILFNNMSVQGGDNDNSIVMEFTPDFETFEGEVVWTFDNNFYSAKQSGAFRLPNGNTFTSVAQDGYMFEVTYDGEVVWELYQEGVFRAQKYGMNYFIVDGDVNGDGNINILDVVLVVNYILDNLYVNTADVNNDMVVNVLDVVVLVGDILNVL